ncbi:MAG: ornithine cyclodeaminase family protein [Phenylobacterium sp.]|uniref:ornithine cyclodeaminase family protein n=1 Tax=Phenylobacterium sp. TaxID=1871053 RepID=UPI00391C7690
MTGAVTTAGLRIWDAQAVRSALTYDAAIPVVRQAMAALSSGEVRQLLRSFIGLGEGRTFAIMPAALDRPAVFGAKLVSVFADGRGRKSHEGLVVLFEGEEGAPVCLADAGEVTAIRTAAASAAATDALARTGAARLAILGLGRQAEAHIEAISKVRDLREVRVWGRDAARAGAFADAVRSRTGLSVTAYAGAREAVAGADIVCTVSAAADPILEGGWVSPGAHVNLVGSSGPAQAEADAELVAMSRFIVDHREHVLVHGGEFLRAKAAGRVGDAHIAGEIGEVYARRLPGRTSAEEITVYKSLGHAVQDLACVAWLDGRRD